MRVCVCEHVCVRICVCVLEVGIQFKYFRTCALYEKFCVFSNRI